MKFDKALDASIDLSRVNWPALTPWIEKRVTELLGGVEDDVLIGYISEQLVGQTRVDPRELQINLTGFLEGGAAPFVSELWTLLASASTHPAGIPAQLLADKAAELAAARAAQEEAAARVRAAQAAATARLEAVARPRGGDERRGRRSRSPERRRRSSRSPERRRRSSRSRERRRRSRSPERRRRSRERERRQRSRSHERRRRPPSRERRRPREASPGARTGGRASPSYAPEKLERKRSLELTP